MKRLRSKTIVIGGLSTLAILASCSPGVSETVTREAITYEQFQKLAVGQTMAQVGSIVGHNPAAYKTQAVGEAVVEVDEWVNADGSGAAVVQSKGLVIEVLPYRLETPTSPAYTEAKKRLDALAQHS